MKGITDSVHYEDIATALRAAFGNSVTYLPAEMAAAVSAIKPNDVWIGSQLAYNALTEYKVTTVYIIFESNQIKRCYIGDVMIYDDPVTWDYIVNNRVFTGGYYDIIETGFKILDYVNFPTPWEFIFDYSDYTDNDNGSILMACHRNTINLFYDSSKIYLRCGNTIDITGITKLKFTRDENFVIRVFNNATQEQLISFTNASARPEQLCLGGFNNDGTRNCAKYIMNEFKYRWVT